MSTPEPIDEALAARVRAVRLLVFDFDGVFTDNSVYVFEDGREAVRCNRSDGLGLSRLRARGLGLRILSTEPNPVVSARAKKLGIECEQGCADKGAAIARIAEETALPLSALAFVGNDVNDAPCLRCVGLPIVVADAHPDVWPLALYRTDAAGGRGAVREVCDLFERVLGVAP